MAAKTLMAPLERIRIIQQVAPMYDLKPGSTLKTSTLSLFNKISHEQGTSALWRGNNASMYRNFILITLNVSIFDKIKHSYMP